MEGYDRRHHAQLHATIELKKPQVDVEGIPTAGAPTMYATCGVIDECASI